MHGLDPATKPFFKIKRFMDDILCFYVRNDKWDYEKFIQDLCKSEVYVKPLTLEDGKEGTFLETSFRMRNLRLLLRSVWCPKAGRVNAGHRAALWAARRCRGV